MPLKPWRAVLALGLVLCLPLVAAAKADCPSLDRARAWLALADQGRYAESREMAAPYFRQAVNQADWLKAMRAVRAPLGKVLQRRLTHCRSESRLAGAPDGRYQILKFRTAFSHKRESVETLAMKQTPDGTWSMVGYFIK